MFTATFFGSLVLSSYYTGGDQTLYILFYDAARASDLVTTYTKVYGNTLGAAEPLYCLLVWISSRFIEKDVFVAIANTILVAVVALNLRRFTPSKTAVLVTLPNFYFLVLALAAERLKFGMIFLGVMFLVKRKDRPFWALVAMLFHFQIGLILLVIFAFPNWRRILVVLSRYPVQFWTGAVAGGFLLIAFFDYLTGKLGYYSSWFEWTDLLKATTMLVLTVFIADSRQKNSAFLNQLVLLIFCFFLGSERIIIFMYLVFVYRVLESRRFLHPVNLALIAYFTFEGVGFVESVLRGHTGFG